MVCNSQNEFYIKKCVASAKLKFSPALFEKIPSFVCLVYKIEKK